MNAIHTNFLQLLNGDCQYVVPRWQRRYRWGRPEIERLIEDLLAVAKAEHQRRHYGGALITFPEPGPVTPGTPTTYRVVDGQQRLTTVSLLLVCIADVLGEDRHYGGWTAEFVRHRLTNRDIQSAKRYKLRLQEGDDEEYRNVLEGGRKGPGAVTQAWRTIRRLIAKHDNNVADLIRGLERLWVVSLGLGDGDDAQQIFESLNATGRPLTESEKVKNWFLIGLSDYEQERLYDECWVKIEDALDARYSSERIDIFLRDLLRWWTGDLQGVDKVYEGLRRWAVKTGRDANRQQLLRDIVPLAELYGILTGSKGSMAVHPHKDVEKRLRHLRAMGIDVHRPFSLRLLHDLGRDGISPVAVADVLHYIGAWITRLWLADRRLRGLNRAMVDLAHSRSPNDSEDFADYWLDRISALGDGHVAVPSDEEVRQGIRTRRAYGASATTTAFSILCAIMEDEHDPSQCPARAGLTVEHVMPKKLTGKWRHDLGEEADEIHKLYLHRLANLTLSGGPPNTRLGIKEFEAKKTIYRKSTIGMTIRIADKSAWNEEVMDQRAGELADEALRLWEWPRPIIPRPSKNAHYRWRINDRAWKTETLASSMLLNVASALITRNPGNVSKLLGPQRYKDLQRASEVPANTERYFRPVPGFRDYVICPHDNYLPRCREMGRRCGVSVEAETLAVTDKVRFWRRLADEGGVPGLNRFWKITTQWTDALSSKGEKSESKPGLTPCVCASASTVRSTPSTSSSYCVALE